MFRYSRCKQITCLHLKNFVNCGACLYNTSCKYTQAYFLFLFQYFYGILLPALLLMSTEYICSKVISIEHISIIFIAAQLYSFLERKIDFFPSLIFTITALQLLIFGQPNIHNIAQAAVSMRNLQINQVSILEPNFLPPGIMTFIILV